MARVFLSAEDKYLTDKIDYTATLAIACMHGEQPSCMKTCQLRLLTYQEQQECLVVAMPNTVVDPRAVVILHVHMHMYMHDCQQASLTQLCRQHGLFEC